nr:hypothetical protein [Pandoravirus belohorizontensis]
MCPACVDIMRVRAVNCFFSALTAAAVRPHCAGLSLSPFRENKRKDAGKQQIPSLSMGRIEPHAIAEEKDGDSAKTPAEQHPILSRTRAPRRLGTRTARESGGAHGKGT